MEELRDIKGFVEVPDESFFYSVLMMFFLGILLAFFAWLYSRWREPKRRKRRLSAKELAKLRLSEIDFIDTKEAVYTFSEAGQVLSPEHPALLSLLSQLEQYKFKKEVPELSEEDKREMKRIIKELTHG